MANWSPERRRRLRIALGIYALVVAIFFAVTPRYRIVAHTAFNHFSLLAEAWLHGRLDLNVGPPAYGQNNDFAAFGGKWYVAFPPFPAVLLLPVVFFGKTAENVRDGQFFVWAYVGIDCATPIARSQATSACLTVTCPLPSAES